jgi:hypothetical protein
MNDRERIIKIINDLNLNLFKNIVYVINGSGSMIMHGITSEDRGKEMGDLDIFVPTATWFNYYHGRVRTVYNIHFCVEYTDPYDPRRRCDPPLIRAVMYGLPVDMFFSWRRRGVGDIDINFMLNNVVEIDGVNCVPLQMVYDWKCQVGRAKDQRDIELLKEAGCTDG